MKNKKIKEKVLKISEGILSTLTDLVLGEIFFGFEFITHSERGQIGVEKAIAKAYEDLAKINYKSIKGVLDRLKRRGLIEYIIDEGLIKPVLTKQGRQRFEATLPTYIENRPWNGKLYLIFYDFPEINKNLRDVFRNYLYKIGSGTIQKSVFLIWYDPTEVLREFIEKHRLKGLIIISCLGKDGYVSGEEVKDLVARIYKVEGLNDRYREFLAKYSKNDKANHRSKIVFELLSILKDDPQLPSELLPENWVGKKAYPLYKKLLR